MSARTPQRHWSSFSLWSLLALVSAAGPVFYAGYSLTRPFFVVERVNCGGGRYVELLRPNGFCDKAGSVHYRFSGMKDYDSPPSFTIWGCGYDPKIAVIAAEQGNLVAIATADEPDEIHILIDFAAGTSWPRSWSGKVDALPRDMLARLRRERGELWLANTDNGELTKPRPP